jgi:hypothetical protein
MCTFLCFFSQIVDHYQYDFFDRDGLGDGSHAKRLRKDPSFKSFVREFVKLYMDENGVGRRYSKGMRLKSHLFCMCHKCHMFVDQMRLEEK